MGSTKVVMTGAASLVLLGLVGLCVVVGSLGTINTPVWWPAQRAGPPVPFPASAQHRQPTPGQWLRLRSRGGRQAALIALMTGLTKAGLRVLTNPSDPAGDLYPSQGVGYDHDSLGIFQQRPSWGTAAQRMDPVVSTGLFLDRLSLGLRTARLGQ